VIDTPYESACLSESIGIYWRTVMFGYDYECDQDLYSSAGVDGFWLCCTLFCIGDGMAGMHELRHHGIVLGKSVYDSSTPSPRVLALGD
jgi:hypothetical protein